MGGGEGEGEETVDAGSREKESQRWKKKADGGKRGVGVEKREGRGGRHPPTDDRLMNLWMKSCRGCPLGCG